MQVLESSGNVMSRSWKVFNLTLLCFKFGKFALRFVCVQLKNNYGMLLT